MTRCALALTDRLESALVWIVFPLLLILLLGVSHVSAQSCAGDGMFFPGQETGQLRANRMNAISGMSASRRTPGVLWAHNDVNIDRVFAINTEGRPLGTFTLPQKLLDAEDIAIGPGPVAGLHYIYIADTGDEQKVRSSITVVRVPEPSVELDPDDQETQLFANAAHLNLTYPSSNHDCEALLIDPRSGDLLFITKEQTLARVFTATQAQLANGSAVLAFAGEVPLGGVTAGDISPDGALIALRSENKGLIWSRKPNETVAQAIVKTPALIPLVKDEAQGESLAFDSFGNGFYTTSAGEDRPIYYFRRNTTGYSSALKLGVVGEPELAEVSGVAASRQNPGLLWVHNDGTGADLYAVGTNGTLRGRFRFSRDLLDFEDIAVGPGPDSSRDYIYAGDIGDNNSERENIQIVRVPEPRITASSPATAADFESEVAFTLKYPDGSHDAEALMVDPITGDIFIATKEDAGFRLYKAIQSDLGINTANVMKLVHKGSFGLVSGGVISADGRRIILRREDAARLWERSPNQSVEQALSGAGEEIPVVGPPEEPNGEGVTFQPSEGGYYTISEGASPAVHLFVPRLLAAFEGGPVRTTSGWRLSIRGCPGALVRVEGSADLIQWHLVGQAIIAEEAVALVDPTNFAQRFFRLISGR
jgi:hypothetical protein